MIWKGTHYLQRLSILAVGLMEVIRHPQVQKQEGVAWPDKGCSLQKVILLIPDVTLYGRQGAGIPNLRELLPIQPSQERVLETEEI